MAVDCIIDVSDAQGAIDFAAVAAAGVRLAFVKASEGSTYQEKRFDANTAGFAAAGLTVVPYTFLRPGSSDAEVANFVRTARLTAGMAAMVDWEGRASQTCTAAEAEAVGAKIALVTGREVVGYFGIPGSTPQPATEAMERWCRFIPRYPRAGAEKFGDLPLARQDAQRLVPGAMFWQYTKWGRVSGITGPVDRSVWLGSDEELTAWMKTGQRPPWAAVPAVPYPGFLAVGARGEGVRELQERLAALGFSPGPADGVYGMRTQDALDLWRAARGTNGTGIGVSEIVWNTLFA